MKGKWLVVLAALVVVMTTGVMLVGCKNNSDDDEACVVTFYPNVPKDVTGVGHGDDTGRHRVWHVLRQGTHKAVGESSGRQDAEGWAFFQAA